MKVIHLNTRITTEYGVLDEGGNVVQRVPIQADLPRLDMILMGEAVEAIQVKRAELAQQVEAQEQAQQQPETKPTPIRKNAPKE